MRSDPSPEHLVAIDRGPHRQRPAVADLRTDELAARRRSHACHPRPQSEHFTPSAPGHFERSVQDLVGIGDAERSAARFGRAVLIEEGLAGVVHCHEYEDDAGYGWVAHGEPGEVGDDLLREQSTEMAEKDQQDGSIAREFSQCRCVEANAIDGKIEHRIGQVGMRTHHLSMRRRPGNYATVRCSGSHCVTGDRCSSAHLPVVTTRV